MKDANIFGHGIWYHHVLYVVKFAKELAPKLGADEEIVEIAALLHDHAGISNSEHYAEHHIHGARLAGEILTGFAYPEEKIEQVKQCIFSHRGSVLIERNSPEEVCLASADAMAHIDQAFSLLLFRCKRKGASIEEGCAWVHAKLERSWNKLCPEAQEMMKETYLSTQALLKQFM